MLLEFHLAALPLSPTASPSQRPSVFCAWRSENSMSFGILYVLKSENHLPVRSFPRAHATFSFGIEAWPKLLVQKFKFGKVYRTTPFALFGRFLFASPDGLPCTHHNFYSYFAHMRSHSSENITKLLARSKWIDIIKENARDGPSLPRFLSHRYPHAEWMRKFISIKFSLKERTAFPLNYNL